MIIVSGTLHVNDRDRYLESCDEVIRLARAATGCVDFHLSADRLDAARVNVFEQWETVADVETFRSSGPGDDQSAVIRDAAVDQHDIASTTRL